MASVAYGPEAIVLVLATAGGAGLGFTVPVTLAIAALLAVLVASYRQVIVAFPNGGGAYAVARAHLGRRTSLAAAASLIIDYVLNVAVSIAAGVAALTSAIPGLLPYTVWICLAILVGVTAINLRGIAESARAFMLPTVIFVGSIAVVIVAGLLRSHPASVAEGAAVASNAHTIGILLLLKAFSSGCAALTGVEAIANAVPDFKAPKVVRAQRAEVALGALLGTMLIGLSILIAKFSLHPVEGTTVLAQLTEAALGHGIGYYVVQFATVVLLALAANTSYGGLPTLLRILADDNCLPHRFAMKSHRDVYRYGVVTLGIAAGVLLIGADGNMNALVPLFAIGVFVGFTIAQAGLVRHWLLDKQSGWQWRAALNGFGCILTFVAAIVTTAMKFTSGAWLVVLALPALVLLMERIRNAYTRIDNRVQRGAVPPIPAPAGTVVVVPVAEVSQVSREALCAGMSIGSDVVAVHVCLPGESTTRFTREWDDWHPDVRLVLLDHTDAEIAAPIVDYVRREFADRRVVVVIGEVDAPRPWRRILPSHHVAELDRLLRKDTDALVCHVRLDAVGV
ncbi:APC family permease [Antrihabitans cavernicola]|uniref:APC family permease n=1 Tax=Antrihabitans cavernicola TaxID=2495913 RepID=A0A5A7SEW4_9NOCA|nr:APC family permease [Spelaeibacter cavernicola]KAA0023692.1 APC family permease [Spelaeibacter cavernicola]